MNSLFAILLGFPSILVIAVLSFIGVVSTLSNVMLAIRIGDLVYLYAFVVVTFVAAVTGWILGGFL